MRYQWLLFDADGTLFDYDRAESAALRQTFEETGQRFEPDYAAAYHQVNAAMWLDFERGQITQARLRTKRFELLFGGAGLDLDAQAFSRNYLRNLASRTDLIDGAEELLRCLHTRVRLALITNGLSEVQRPRLARSSIGGYFETVVISEEVGVAKPHPGIFDVALQQMGYPAREQVLVVGDSLTSDMRGASSSGLDACWYNPAGRPRPAGLEIRYEIRELGQLLPLLDLPGQRGYGTAGQADERQAAKE